MNEPRARRVSHLLAMILVLASLLSMLPAAALADAEDFGEAQTEETSVIAEEPVEETVQEEIPAAEPDVQEGPAEDGGEPAEGPVEEPGEEPDEEPDEAPDGEPAEDVGGEAPELDADADYVSPFETDAKGNRYYINPKTGARHTGWLYLDGLWYYFWSDGTMATGWCCANDGYWYYFNKETGVVHRGWATSQGYKYYMRPEDGREQTGWRKIDGEWYYFWPDGKMATGWTKANDGYWYYFDKETGIPRRGWVSSQGYKYYMRPEDATEQTGWRVIDGNWYYFGSDGRMRTGWQLIAGNKYYFAKAGDGSGFPEGANVADVEVDGYWVNADGYTTASWTVWERMVRLAEFQSSDTQYLILVDTTYCKVGVFQGSHGNWEGIYYWDCSPGAYSTPTVKGNFTINSKGTYFYGANTGCRCWYWSEFYGGDYAFHSVLYTPSGYSVSDGRLGMHLSHGCVRLHIDNAYWIYANCPIGTAVLSY